MTSQAKTHFPATPLLDFALAVEQITTKKKATGRCVRRLVTRTLLGAPGLTTRNKDATRRCGSGFQQDPTSDPTDDLMRRLQLYDLPGSD